MSIVVVESDKVKIKNLEFSMDQKSKLKNIEQENIIREIAEYGCQIVKTILNVSLK